MEGLRGKLAELLRRRAALVFLGNELRGDDAAGLRVGRLLLRLCGRRDALILCPGGLENCAGEVRRAAAEVVILVDAVDAGLEPGAVVLASLSSERCPPPLSTHDLPKGLLLSLAGVREAWVLGVQVGSLEVGSPLSPEVSRACEALAGLLAGLLCGTR